MFTETLSATVGPSYVASFFLGGLIGMTKLPPPKSRRTYKLMINSYFNNIGKTSARFGNNVGGAIFMFLMVGKTGNFLFQEEISDSGISVPVQNAVFGGVTGALYKSTRGKRAMVLGSILGTGIGSLYGLAWSRGMFRFKI